MDEKILNNVSMIESLNHAAKTMYDWVKLAAMMTDENIGKYFGEVTYSLYDIVRIYDEKEFVKRMEKYMEENPDAINDIK